MTITNAPTAVQAVGAAKLTQSIGINTHIDFSWSAYNNLASVQNALAYLGVQNVRDAIDNPADLAKFAALNKDLGIKFGFFIAPGSVGMAWQLQQIESDPAIVRYVEGANESDNWPQTYNGLAGLAATEAEQKALYASVTSELPGVAVIGPSFGQLATFPTVGNLSSDAKFGNAHIYFGSGNNPADQDWIQTLIQDANLVTPGKPVMTTETGYYTSTDPTDPNAVDDTVQAKYLLDDIMDQFKAGVSMDYLYELVDEGSDPTDPEDNFGLFTDNWTPKPAAIALHDFMHLMQPAGSGNVTPGKLSYSLSGMPATGNSELLEKSDGTFVLVLWNDVRLTGPTENSDITVPNVPVTLTLASAAQIKIFDPLTGTTAVQTAADASTLTLSVPDHPILVEIGPDAGAPTTSAPSPPAPPAIPAAPTGVSVSAPNSATVDAGLTVTVAGVSVSDPWAAGMLGTMTLNLGATLGTLALTDPGGHAVAGSGGQSISLNASIFQVNTDLARLAYTAGTAAGRGTITVDVWDPAGLEATKTIAVTVEPPPAPPPPAGPTIAAPGSKALLEGATTSLGTVAIADVFAASNPGSMVLNLSAGSGSLSVSGDSGATVSGSGTGSITIDGTLAQLNADLAHLAYTVGKSAGVGSIGIDVWDQAGNQAMAEIAVTVTAPPPPAPSPPAPPPPAPPALSISIAATDTAPVITVSHGTITATAGDHTIFIGGTSDVISAVGGIETVMAFQGGNTISTGAGNDTIRIAGSGNVVNAGGGANEIDDSGGGNRIVLPLAGQGSDDIYGYALQNGDVLDLRPLLAGTTWNGSAASIGHFLQIQAANGADAVISATPSGAVGGTSDAVATLHGSGAISLASLLAQAIT